MKPISILIVEDELLIATNLKLILKDIGYEPLDPVGTKEEALRVLQETTPDIAILDINLQGKHDGIEIGSYIQQNLHIPFIFLTSNADKETIYAAKQVRPAAYLIKPFSEDDIFAAIEVAVSNFSETPSPPVSSTEDGVEKIPIFSNALFIKVNNRYIKTNISDITYIRVDDKYVELFTSDDKKFIVRVSLDSILHQLAPFNFIRTHRSFAINPKYLQEINGDEILVNQTKIPIGRAFRDVLLKQINTL